jgi:hypothetical protein
MSEAVSSGHDSNSRLPEATQTEGLPMGQEEGASGESLQGVIREPLAELSTGIPLDTADWQPVEFPDAISLTQLSHPVSPKSELSPLSAVHKDDHRSDLRKLVDQLQQENSAFRVQVSQLERDLTQAQVELQLEVTRFYCKSSESAILQSEALKETAAQSPLNSNDLAAIHQQISQLSQELDLSQKMGHRQQILVETLSAQLESSQERIAHLERDCAITQQRYNEQVQLVLQAENVCRDLRMRLHRQQRQALQFKAALEKSLEMASVPGGAIAQSDLTSPNAMDAATPFIPKVQPVQPWSQNVVAESHYATCRGEEHILLNLFSKLLMADQQPTEGVEITPIQEVELASIQVAPRGDQGDPVQAVELASIQVVPKADQGNQSADDDIASAPSGKSIAASTEVVTLEEVAQYMSLIFPKQTDTPAQPHPVISSQEPVFDVNPFLETDEANSMKTPAVELRPIAKNILPPLLHPPRPKQSTAPQPPLEAPSPSPALNQPGDRENNLWADLAKLIEPDLLVDDVSTTDLPNQPGEQVSVSGNPFQSAAELMSSEKSDQKPIEQSHQGDRPKAAKPLSLDFFAYIEKKATSTPNSDTPNSDTPNSDIPRSDMPNSEVLNAGSNPKPKSANANLSHFEKKTAAPEETLESSPSRSNTSENNSATSPSPVLYPFRPAKKLQSMSAVELPSFRQAAH